MLSFDCGVCTPAVALRLLYSNRGMCCALCVCFFLYFSQKNTGGALQCDGAVMHNSSSEHSTAVGHTRYSAAPAQPYNFDAAPAQQYSPRVSPLPTCWPDRNNSRRLTNPRQLPQKVKTTHKLAGLTGWLTTQLIPIKPLATEIPSRATLRGLLTQCTLFLIAYTENSDELTAHSIISPIPLFAMKR